MAYPFAIPVLQNAVLPAPLALSGKGSIMECSVVQQTAGAIIHVQSSEIHFNASVQHIPMQTLAQACSKGTLPSSLYIIPE